MKWNSSDIYLGILVMQVKDAGNEKNCRKEKFAITGKFGTSTPWPTQDSVTDLFLCGHFFFKPESV